jgi:hypothetical protein
MNGNDSLDAPLFLQSDEDRLRADVQARWAEALTRVSPLPDRGRKPPPDAIERVFTPTGEYWGPPLAGKPQGPTLTRCDLVLRVLLDGQWHATTELLGPKVGGSEGMRRLRELRERGWAIQKRRREGSAQWEYRIPLPEPDRVYRVGDGCTGSVTHFAGNCGCKAWKEEGK